MFFYVVFPGLFRPTFHTAIQALQKASLRDGKSRPTDGRILPCLSATMKPHFPATFGIVP